MRYHYEKPKKFMSLYGDTYHCEGHPVYNFCTLYLIGEVGLAVIQQKYDADTKKTWWQELDPWLTDELYLHPYFLEYFEQHAGEPIDGVYPTVTIRQIMHGLKMKPMRKEVWETVFDRGCI